MALTNKLTNIANAIRSKTGGTSQLTLEQMVTAINSIETGGGGLAYADELYSDDALAITYTSTSAGTAKTISNITNLKYYPFIAVVIENTDSTASASKFLRSVTIIGNSGYATGAVSVTRYGCQQYYNASSAVIGTTSTTYGLWGYTISTANALTIRGRTYASYYTTLTGTYKVRVIGIKF